jgi:hypothetical protein
MARDLKPGDCLRSVGGVSAVRFVEDSASEPVFNLRVMEAQSFFVGLRGMLVHDNSLVEPIQRIISEGRDGCDPTPGILETPY